MIPSIPSIPGATLAAMAAVALSCLISGAVLLLMRRTEASRGVLISGGLLACGGLLGLAGALLAATGAAPLVRPFLVAAGALLLPLALATYPRVRWQHPVGIVALAVIVVLGALAVVQSTSPSAVGSLGLAIVGILVAHTWWRLERTSGEERRAVQWMALGAGTSALVAALLSFAWEGQLVGELAVALLILIGPTLCLGMTSPELVDVRGAVVGAVVTLMAVLAYMAVFVGLAALLELTTGVEPEVGALALVGALAALTLRPLQVLLRGVVDQLIFGLRPDPLGAAQEVAGHIGDDPVLALQPICEALVLPYASLRVSGAELASSGQPTPHTYRVVVDRDTDLVVGLRAGDLAMPRSDEQVLHVAAPLLAQALRARALVAELHASREQTVAALAEERRRLRRDLHDGLGPRLSGIAFSSDAARNLLRVDPDGADALLRTLRAETVTAIEDIRELVYAMRPPALDELGLVGALRQRALGLRTAHGGPLTVAVSARDDLSSLPAAVEVAAYRIVVEALTNIGRHTTSPTASVSLRLDGSALLVSVRDEHDPAVHSDDMGGTPGCMWTAGVGLTSMHDRAVELGGTLTAGPSPSGGRVDAVLPV